MRIFALIAGVLFILLGIAGFAKMIAIATMYAVVLIVAGALFALFGATNRRPMVPNICGIAPAARAAASAASANGWMPALHGFIVEWPLAMPTIGFSKSSSL